jgi:hypothetical protein
MYQPVALRPDQIEALYYLKVELHCPMTKLVRQAVDDFLREIERKREHACRAGTTLSDWLAYEEEMGREASAAAKLNADLRDANAPF